MIMNVGRRDYAERRAARIERLEARAARLQRESAQAFGTARRISDGIPFGQPILVGHHSERRHRRDAAKIESNMRKGVAAAAEAERLDRRAARAESNEAISSDDPEAIAKLRAKVAEIETTKERMKFCNTVIRKARKAAAGKGTDETQAIIDALVKALGWPKDKAALLTKPDCFGNIGFADFELTNRGAEVRRLKKRIAELEARATVPETELTFGDVKVVLADNRVQIHFPGKPSDELRTELKQNGFKWAPSVGAWQRMPSQWAWDMAKRIAARAGKASDAR
jgi:hypothetical protein